jgi:MoxR-like ATPase
MTTPGDTPTPSPLGSTPARLPAGELRRQVAAFLASHPDTTFTTGAVTKALGARSSGAVGNALAMLAGHGHARLVDGPPRRYGPSATTAAAATPAPPTAAATASPAPALLVSDTAPRTAGAPGSVGRSDTSRAPRGRRATVPEAPDQPVPGRITRPNGMAYAPRTLSGMADVTALRKLRTAGVPALLYGPPGTGKTSVVEAAFGDVYTVAGDGDTTVADLLGEYTQSPDGRYVFSHGPVVRAMREGRPLFIDDTTLIPPSVLAVVYPAMDGRREIIVKANAGEIVTAAEGFYVIGGHNPGVHGAILSDALSSRFAVQIQVSTDYELAKELGIDSRATRVARNLAARQARGEIGWAPQLRELIAFQKIASVLGVKAAASNLIGIAPEADRDVVTEAVGKTFGEILTPLALGAQLRPDTPASTPTAPTGTSTAAPIGTSTAAPVATGPVAVPAAVPAASGTGRGPARPDRDVEAAGPAVHASSLAQTA